MNVSVGILTQLDKSVLLGKRQKNKSWANCWELPGGKVEFQETPLEALKRELSEEIGINIEKAYPWIRRVHPYKDSVVRLIFFRVIRWKGVPSNLEHQALKWFGFEKIQRMKKKIIPSIHFPLRWLNLPTSYGITSIKSPMNLNSFLNRLDESLSKGLKLVQFREPNWADGCNSKSLCLALDKIIQHCHNSNAKVLINSIHPEFLWKKADGVHLRTVDLNRKDIKSYISKSKALIGASTHNYLDLIHARDCGVDFALLGPVLKTLTHSSANTIGWDKFRELAKNAGIPVFALGGQSHYTKETAFQNGAHGISGIRFLI